MVASRQVEIPFHRGVGRQRGRVFGALAQVFGRNAVPFLRKFFVPAAKRVGADLLEFAVPKIAEVLSGRKNFKTAAKNVGNRLCENSWVVVAGRGLRAESFQQNLQYKSVGREDTFLHRFLIKHVELFSVPVFFGSFRKSWSESPSS